MHINQQNQGYLPVVRGYSPIIISFIFAFMICGCKQAPDHRDAEIKDLELRLRFVEAETAVNNETIHSLAATLNKTEMNESNLIVQVSALAHVVDIIGDRTMK
jgi:hypothetical protein